MLTNFYELSVCILRSLCRSFHIISLFYFIILTRVSFLAFLVRPVKSSYSITILRYWFKNVLLIIHCSSISTKLLIYPAFPYLLNPVFNHCIYFLFICIFQNIYYSFIYPFINTFFCIYYTIFSFECIHPFMYS